MTTIRFDDPQISMTGRIAMQPEGAHFYWAASSAAVRFTGTRLSVTVCCNSIWGTNSLGLVADGRVSRVPVARENNGKDMTFLLAEGLEEGMVHTVILYKRLDASYDYVVKAFETDGEFQPALPKPDLKLEFYGDSVTSGCGVECVDYVGRGDPSSNDSSYDNSWYGYAWQTARALDAQVHTTSQGGISVFNGTGYFHMPETIGMEDTWNKLCYFPEAGELTEWDFSKYQPQIVVFALGQNDQHNAVTGENDRDVSDPVYRRVWKDGYKQIAHNVAAKYPADTQYIFITTLLMHDLVWDETIDEVAQELRAEGLRASHFMFTRNGKATPGHPRIPEHEEMARELTAYIKTLL